ncbi:MAG: hypothetical protein AAF371_01175 [Pseudomonadota bacterium]
MTFAIARHAETIARHHVQGAVPAPPPPLVVTASPITNQDFSLVDLGLGDRAGLVLHRIDIAVPERAARLQYRVDGSAVRDLPQPVIAGSYEIEGLAVGQAAEVELRVVSIDPATGTESVEDWSPARSVTTSRFSAVNILSETVNPVLDAVDAWDDTTVWDGVLDSDGYARFASPAALQVVSGALLPGAGETLLLIVELKAGGAAVSGLSFTYDLEGGGQAVAVADITWSNGTVSTAGSAGMAALGATRVTFDAGAGTARLALVFTLPASAGSGGAVRITGAGTSFRAPDLRPWTFGDTDWPAHEPWDGPSGVRRLTPPVTTGFGTDTLELDTASPWGVAFTVFGEEEAVSGEVSARTFTLSEATVEAGGSGYADGSYVLAVDGGRDGRVQITVSGGSVTAAAIVSPGRLYTIAPSVQLDGFAGGFGAVVTIERTKTLRDFWPAVNDGRTRASWDGRSLGSAGFAVEGFVAEGQFWPAGASFAMPSGVILRVEADGSWSAKANGTTDGVPLGEGGRRSIGLVVGNGGTRSVLDMPVGFTGDGMLPLRIVTTPRLTGSARLGDALLALPGAVEVDEDFTPALFYQWLTDGAPMIGETAPRLRLSPGKVFPGQAVSCRVTWDGPGGNESWETSARVVEDWKVVADGNTVSIGALTPAGLRGVPVAAAGTTIVSGDASGHWAIGDVDGIAHLRPAIGPATAGSDPVTAGEGAIAGSYTLGLSDGRSLTVNVAAGTITCACHGDLVAVAQASGAALGQGVYNFSFASGITLAFWNSGDWGGVDDIADPASRFEDLELVGSDSDGGAGRVQVLPYDAAADEATAVTGPLHFARVRNLDWQVDIDHSEQSLPGARSPLFLDGALIVPGEAARTVAFRDCRIRGGFLMAERLRRARDPSGIVLGAGGSQMASSGAAAFLLERVEIVDTGAVTAADFGAISVVDCRVHRTGVRPFRIGNDVSALTLKRVEAYDLTASTPFDPGAWISATPEGATGYAPVYRPGVAITVEDCLLYPGQSRLPALGGLRLLADPDLAQGGEAAFGYVYSAVSILRSLIVGGGAEMLLLTSGEAGEITDSALYVDARNAGLAEAVASHLNGFRPLGSGFALTRSVLGIDALGTGVARTDAVTLSAADYGVAFEGSGAAFAPRTRTDLLAAFTPVAGGAVDLAGGGSAGPVAPGGAFKGSAGSLPGATGVDWGVPSYGIDTLVTGIGWGAIPFAAPAFGIAALRLSGPAPLFVGMGAAGVSRDQKRDDTFTWDFDEDYDFEALPAESRAPRAARTSRGPDTCHLFRTPGTRRVTMRQRNSVGLDRVAVIDVSVEEPDDWFSGNRTMVLNPVGDTDFAGAPPGAIQRNADPDGLAAALAHVRGERRRLLLKSGQAFGFGTTVALGVGSHFGAYGGSASATLLNDGVSKSSVLVTVPRTPMANAVVSQISADGGWDVATGNASPFSDVFTNSDGSIGTVFDRCSFANGDGFGLFGDHVGHIDCRIENWYAYGMISGTQSNAPTFWRGCVFRTDPAYATTDYTAAEREPLFGPIRALSPTGGVFTQGHIDFTYARNNQPGLRLFSTNTTPGPKAFTVTDCHLSGGAPPLQIGASLWSPGVPVVSDYFVVEGNYVELTPQWFVSVQSDYGALRLQNNVFARPAGMIAGQSVWLWLVVLPQNASASQYNALVSTENRGRAVRISHNTLLHDVPRAGPPAPGAAQVLEIRGPEQIFYDVAELSSNATRIHPRNHQVGPHLDPGIDDDGRPYAVNALRGTGTALPPVLDMDGAVRSAPHYAGAFGRPGGTPTPPAPADVSNAALTGLFAGAGGGVWMADSFAGLWQDVAGSVPVTASGQPVARIANLVAGGPDLVIGAAQSAATAHVLGNGQVCLRIDGASFGSDFVATLAQSIPTNAPFSYMVASGGDYGPNASPLTLTGNGFRTLLTRCQHWFNVARDGFGIDLRMGLTFNDGVPARDVRSAVSDGLLTKGWRASPFGAEERVPVAVAENGTEEIEEVRIQAAFFEPGTLHWFGALVIDRALTDAERVAARDVLAARSRGA